MKDSKTERWVFSARGNGDSKCVHEVLFGGRFCGLCGAERLVSGDVLLKPGTAPGDATTPTGEPWDGRSIEGGALSESENGTAGSSGLRALSWDLIHYPEDKGWSLVSDYGDVSERVWCHFEDSDCADHVKACVVGCGVLSPVGYGPLLHAGRDLLAVVSAAADDYESFTLRDGQVNAVLRLRDAIKVAQGGRCSVPTEFQPFVGIHPDESEVGPGEIVVPPLASPGRQRDEPPRPSNPAPTPPSRDVVHRTSRDPDGPPPAPPPPPADIERPRLTVRGRESFMELVGRVCWVMAKAGQPSRVESFAKDLVGLTNLLGARPHMESFYKLASKYVDIEGAVR